MRWYLWEIVMCWYLWEIVMRWYPWEIVMCWYVWKIVMRWYLWEIVMCWYTWEIVMRWYLWDIVMCWYVWEIALISMCWCKLGASGSGTGHTSSGIIFVKLSKWVFLATWLTSHMYYVQLENRTNGAHVGGTPIELMINKLHGGRVLWWLSVSLWRICIIFFDQVDILHR